MAPRLDLHVILKAITTNVYFQPPPTQSMAYPCIVYHRDTGETRFAGNKPYNHTRKYQVTVIDKDPDGPIYDKVAKLESCVHRQFFTADNLNHDVFNLFF